MIPGAPAGDARFGEIADEDVGLARWGGWVSQVGGI